MGKISSNKIKSLIANYDEKSIIFDKQNIFCNVCSVTIGIDKKHQKDRINAHLKSKKHLENIEIQEKNQQEMLDSTTDFTKIYYQDLATAFASAGIPFHKLSHPAIKEFLEKYINTKTPDETTLRKGYLKPIFVKTQERIKEIVSDSNVCFILDETTDSLKRYVLNILVKPINGTNVKPMLLNVLFLEKVNNITVMQAFIDTCLLLWPNGIQYEKVTLVVTDQAQYMLLTIKNLKALCPNIKHVTCLT